MLLDTLLLHSDVEEYFFHGSRFSETIGYLIVLAVIVIILCNKDKFRQP